MERAFCNSEVIDDSVYLPILSEKTPDMKICLNCCASIPGANLAQHIARHNRGRGKDQMCEGCNMSLGTNGGTTHRASGHHNNVRTRLRSYFCLECGGVFDASTKHPHAEHCFNFGQAREYFKIAVPAVAGTQDKNEMYHGKVNSMAGCALTNHKRDKLDKLEVAIGLGRFVTGRDRIVTKTMCSPHLNVHLGIKEGEVAPLCEIVKINPLDDRGNKVECEVCKNLHRMFEADIPDRDLYAAVVNKNDYVRVMYTDKRPAPALRKVVPLGEADALRKKIGKDMFQSSYTFDAASLSFILNPECEEKKTKPKPAPAAAAQSEAESEEEDEEEEETPAKSEEKTEKSETSAPKTETAKGKPTTPSGGLSTGKTVPGSARAKCIVCNRSYTGASCSKCARK